MLRDSRVRKLRKREHENKTGGNWGEPCAFHLSVIPIIWEPGTNQDARVQRTYTICENQTKNKLIYNSLNLKY